MNKLINLKDNDLQQLEGLTAEIREFLITSVSKTGGHLASNLGVIELTIALHYVYDFNKDKIVFDVGHQSYVHKYLTERKDDFKNLRRFGGMSGFPKKDESKYDFFNTGHSSTSISTALGLAVTRDIKGDDYSIIALIGDGSIANGS